MKIVSLGPVPFLGVNPAVITPAAWHDHFGHPPYRTPYVDLVRRMATEVFEPGEPYLYQAEPNLRIHPPGGVAVPWHTDADFGHLPEEWNIWTPLTATTHSSQRLHLQCEDGLIWAPHVRVGEALIFRGATLRHGNATNLTETTRLSFDFRLLAVKDYRDTGARTVLYDVPLRVPEYWRQM